MKQLYIDVLARHDGDESCADSREAIREALDSGMSRLGIEPRKANSECRRSSGAWKATPEVSIVRDIYGLCVVVDPIYAQKLFARESGDPAIGLEHFMSKVRIENPIGIQQ